MSPARLDLGGSNRVALTRAGDLVDNKEVLGDGRKLSRNSTLSPLESVDLRIEFQALTTAARGRHVLLTDARETSYWICRSLLTAACSTVELAEPRNAIFFVVIQTPK